MLPIIPRDFKQRGANYGALQTATVEPDADANICRQRRSVSIVSSRRNQAQQNANPHHNSHSNYTEFYRAFGKYFFSSSDQQFSWQPVNYRSYHTQASAVPRGGRRIRKEPKPGKPPNGGNGRRSADTSATKNNKARVTAVPAKNEKVTSPRPSTTDPPAEKQGKSEGFPTSRPKVSEDTEDPKEQSVQAPRNTERNTGRATDRRNEASNEVDEDAVPSSSTPSPNRRRPANDGNEATAAVASEEGYSAPSSGGLGKSAFLEALASPENLATILELIREQQEAGGVSRFEYEERAGVDDFSPVKHGQRSRAGDVDVEEEEEEEDHYEDLEEEEGAEEEVEAGIRSTKKRHGGRVRNKPKSKGRNTHQVEEEEDAEEEEEEAEEEEEEVGQPRGRKKKQSVRFREEAEGEIEEEEEQEARVYSTERRHKGRGAGKRMKHHRQEAPEEEQDVEIGRKVKEPRERQRVSSPKLECNTSREEIDLAIEYLESVSEMGAGSKAKEVDEIVSTSLDFLRFRIYATHYNYEMQKLRYLIYETKFKSQRRECDNLHYLLHLVVRGTNTVLALEKSVKGGSLLNDAMTTTTTEMPYVNNEPIAKFVGNDIYSTGYRIPDKIITVISNTAAHVGEKVGGVLGVVAG